MATCRYLVAACSNLEDCTSVSSSDVGVVVAGLTRPVLMSYLNPGATIDAASGDGRFSD